MARAQRLQHYSNGVYTVQTNDTLWWICTDLLTEIRNASGNSSMTVSQAITWVVNKNNIPNANLIYKDQRIAIGAEASGSQDNKPNSSTTVANEKVSNTPVITYFGRGIPTPADVESQDPIDSQVQLDSRTMLAVWTWKSETTTEKYIYTWKYTNGLIDKNGDAIWYYENGSNDIDEDRKSDRNYLDAARQATWEIPDGATYVQFQVAAVSRAEEKNGKESKPWSDTQYAISEKFSTSNISLEAPSAPSIQIIDQLTLECTLSNINAQAKKVQFEVWQNETSRYKTGTVVITNVNIAKYSVKLVKSSRFYVRCRISNGTVWSNWSEFSSAVKTIADAPVITEASVDAQTLMGTNTTTFIVNIVWTKRETANSYILEYIPKDVFVSLDQDGAFLPANSAQRNQYDVNEQQGVHPTSTVLTADAFSSSGEYYLHMRAVTDNIGSDWSAIKKISVGSRPDPPTTWESSSSIVVDSDDLKLYWVHNPTDGSPERAGGLYWSFGQKTEEGIVWDDWSGPHTKAIQNRRTGKKRFEISELDILLSPGDPITDTDPRYHQTDIGPAQKRLTRGVNQTCFRWCARTYGAFNTNNGANGAPKDYSDTSTVRYIDIYSQPQVVFKLFYWVIDSEIEIPWPIEPGEAIPSYPFTMTIRNETSDSQKPTSFYLKVSPNEAYSTIDEHGQEKTISIGEPIYESIFSGDSLGYCLTDWGDGDLHFNSTDIQLIDGIEYKFYLEMSTDAGLKATAEHDYTASFESIDIFPRAELIPDFKYATMSIRPYCIDEDENPVLDVWLSVYRREFDGSFTEIASNLDPTNNLFVVDPHPSLNQARYRIFARDKSTGKGTWYDTSGYPMGITDIIIQWDEAWQSFTTTNEDPLYDPEYVGSIIRLPYNIDVSESTDKDVALVDYIGRENPVSYYGTKIGVSGSWSTDIPKSDTDTLYALRRLSRWMGDCYVREPSGIGYWANVSVSFSQTHNEVVIPVSIEVKKVEGGV